MDNAQATYPFPKRAVSAGITVIVINFGLHVLLDLEQAFHSRKRGDITETIFDALAKQDPAARWIMRATFGGTNFWKIGLVVDVKNADYGTGISLRKRAGKRKKRSAERALRDAWRHGLGSFLAEQRKLNYW